MIMISILSWVVRLAGLVALTLGLLHWFARISFVPAHILAGLTLTLALLLLGIVMLFVKGGRLLGLIGVLYALVIPVFGLNQHALLVNDFHWIVQVAHMLVGIGAVIPVMLMERRFKQLRQTRISEMSQAGA